MTDTRDGRANHRPGRLAPQRLPHEHGAPRGILATARERPVVGHSTNIAHLRRLAQHRRARQARLDLLRRRSGAARRRRAPPGRLARSADRAHGARGRDRAHRPDRDGVDDLQLAVQPRPALRLDRPHQRRSRRLEHRHHGRSRHRPQLRARRPARPRRALRARRRVPRRGLQALGLWEDDAVLADKASGVWADQHEDPPRRARRHALLRARARSRRRARRRAARCIVQAGSSEDGKALAARLRRGRVHRAADARRRARRSTRDLKARTRGVGRDADDDQDPARHRARDRRRPRPRRCAQERELDELIVPEYARAQLAQDAAASRRRTCRSIASCRPTCPTEDEIEGAKSRYTLIVELARRERLTVRELHRPARRRPRPPHVRRHAGAGRRRDPGVVRRRAPRTASTSCPPCCRRGSSVRRPGRADPAPARAVPRPSTRARRCATTTD